MKVAHGLFEAHVPVADLDRSVAFYRDVVGLELAYTTEDRHAAFLWIGSPGQAMLGLWAAGSGPQKMTTHIAFTATLDDILRAPRELRAVGVAALDFNAQPTDEPVVLAWMPAASIYFHDPDGHLLEFIAMLPHRPHPEIGVVSWRRWQLEISRSPSAHSRDVPQYSIRAAQRQDLAHIPQIELAAARLLSGHAPESVLRETTSQDELQDALDGGRLWVAQAADAPVGFALVEPLDAGTAHLKEIDVLPAHGRRGIGRQLVEEVCRWACSAGYGCVTLTTFRDVPWNMPFYERLGFRVIPPAALSPALHAVVQEETHRGLDPSRRVVMRRDCGPTVTVADNASPEELA
jgi:lactoylglutathione lyase